MKLPSEAGGNAKVNVTVSKLFGRKDSVNHTKGTGILATLPTNMSAMHGFECDWVHLAQRDQ